MALRPPPGVQPLDAVALRSRSTPDVRRPVEGSRPAAASAAAGQRHASLSRMSSFAAIHSVFRTEGVRLTLTLTLILTLTLTLNPNPKPNPDPDPDPDP